MTFGGTGRIWASGSVWQVLGVRSFAKVRGIYRSHRSKLKTTAWWLVLSGWVLLVMLVPSEVPHTKWDVAAVLIGFAAALGMRRVLPMAAFLVVIVLCAWAATMVEDTPWAPPLMMSLVALAYLVGRADAGEHPLWLQITAAVAIMLVLASPLEMRWQDLGPLSFVMIPTVIFPWLVGRYRYQHAQLISQGWQRAEQLEQEQQAAAEQARLRERTRIAEDMHDSLGHELSLIALRSAALEVDRDLSDRHRDSASELRRSAATATERLREIIGLLRAEGESASVTPVDETIADLVDRARGSSMDITLTLPAEPMELPRMVDRAMHRVVQESLTNAAKHAPGAMVDVQVSQSGGMSTVTVSNALPGEEAPEGVGGGRGLAGLAERVRLAGGALDFSASGGQFWVTARLPNSAEGGLDVAPEPASQSARQHGRARRAARRQLVAAFVVPIALVSVLGGAFATVVVLSERYSVLSPQKYQEIQVGQSRGAIDEHLPMFEMLDGAGHDSTLDPPEGAECEYYRSTRDTASPSDVYELCFAGDKLVAKHVITAEEQLSANRDG